MTMFTLFCLLTGDRPEIVARFGSHSRKKVAIMAMGLLAVTSYWLLLGYLIGQYVLCLNWPDTVLLAIACAAMVFAIDRTILLMVGKSSMVVVARIALAVIIALIGGAALDLVLLDSELNQEMLVIHDERERAMENSVVAKFASEMAAAMQLVERAKAQCDRAEQDFKLEMNGHPSGTGHRGMGKVAAEKKAIWAGHRHDLAVAERAVEEVRGRQAAETAELKNSLRQAALAPALFDRIHAMHRYVARDGAVLTSWFLFTLLLMGFELMPILAKYGFGKTAYEKSQELVESVHARHMARIAGLEHDQLQALATLHRVEREFDQFLRRA